MTELLGGGAGVALAIFAVVALGVVTLVLLWEGTQEFRQQRAVRKKLEEITKGPSPGGGSEDGGELDSLLRQSGEQGRLRWLEPVLLRLPHRQDLAHFLEQADVGWTVGTYLMLTAGLAAAAGLAMLAMMGSWIVPSVAAAAAGAAPTIYVRIRKKRRIREFEEHFPDAIDLLARSLRAGHAFSSGIKAVADESPDPVSGEFRQVFEEQRYGLPLKESLLSLADRVDMVDVRMFVTSVLIQRESGGNLAENLDNLSNIIRQRFKFQRELRTATAQGKLTGWVLGAAPIVAGIGMYALNPDYVSLLWTEELGRWMLAGAALMQVMGFLVIRRIVDIEF